MHRVVARPMRAELFSQRGRDTESARMHPRGRMGSHRPAISVQWHIYNQMWGRVGLWGRTRACGNICLADARTRANPTDPVHARDALEQRPAQHYFAPLPKHAGRAEHHGPVQGRGCDGAIECMGSLAKAVIALATCMPSHASYTLITLKCRSLDLNEASCTLLGT